MKKYTSPELTVIDTTNMEGVFACTNPYSNGWGSGNYYNQGGSSNLTPKTDASADTNCHGGYPPYNPCPPVEESDNGGCGSGWPWRR